MRTAYTGYYFIDFYDSFLIDCWYFNFIFFNADGCNICCMNCEKYTKKKKQFTFDASWTLTYTNSKMWSYSFTLMTWKKIIRQLQWNEKSAAMQLDLCFFITQYTWNYVDIAWVRLFQWKLKMKTLITYIWLTTMVKKNATIYRTKCILSAYSLPYYLWSYYYIKYAA